MKPKITQMLQIHDPSYIRVKRAKRKLRKSQMETQEIIERNRRDIENATEKTGENENNCPENANNTIEENTVIELDEVKLALQDIADEQHLVKDHKLPLPILPPITMVKEGPGFVTKPHRIPPKKTELKNVLPAINTDRSL